MSEAHGAYDEYENSGISNWKVLFAQNSKRIHELMCFMAVLIFPLFAFFDYYTVHPQNFWPLTCFRLGISGAIGLWLYFQRKYNLEEKYLSLFSFLAISWFCCFASALSPTKFLYQHNVAFSTVFLAASLFLLWPWHFSIIVVVSTLVLYVCLIVRYTHLTMLNVLLEGGAVCLTMMLLHPIIIYFRYNSNKREYVLKSKLAESNMQLKLNKREADNRNKELMEAREKLDSANKELKKMNQNLEDLVYARTLTLESTNTRLHHALDELDSFLYGSFHDLKGPVARLKGLALLIKNQPLEPNVIHFNELSLSTIAEMEAMMEKLKEISDLYNSEVVKEEIELRQVITEVLVELPLDGWTITVDGKMDTKVASHRDFLRSILRNVISNCITYKDETKDAFCLKIQFKANNRGFGITVEDNGIGIENKLMDKIFHMFYRGNERSKGHGLGLYIAKRAVEKLNGTIEVESEVGRFTSVKMFFPY